MLSSLSKYWARITGKDTRQTYPQQQARALGRTGNFVVVFPYGHHCDLPDNALLRVIAPGIAIPVAVNRPGDAGRNEPTFYHPDTNSRIIFKTDGTVFVESGEGGTAPVVVNCTQANITASESVTMDTPQATITGSLTVGGNANIGGNETVGGYVQAAGAVASATNVGVGTGGSISLGFTGHTHSQGSDSNGDSEVETNPPTGA